MGRDPLVDIETAIRSGIAQQCTDVEIARRIGVVQSTICRWRHKLGLQPADKFSRHFVAHYGPDAIPLFQRLVDQRYTLREIGDVFGRSHEWVRQVYAKLYGHPYGEVRPRGGHRHVALQQDPCNLHATEGQAR